MTPRFDLAFTGAGIAFIVTLVIAAMLSMSHKENAEHLGKGSGVNLSSAKKPSHGFGGHGQASRAAPPGLLTLTARATLAPDGQPPLRPGASPSRLACQPAPGLQA